MHLFKVIIIFIIFENIATTFEFEFVFYSRKNCWILSWMPLTDDQFTPIMFLVRVLMWKNIVKIIVNNNFIWLRVARLQGKVQHEIIQNKPRLKQEKKSLRNLEYYLVSMDFITNRIESNEINRYTVVVFLEWWELKQL